MPDQRTTILMWRKMPSQVLADEAQTELLASGIYVLKTEDPSVALGLLWDLQNRHPGARIRKYRSAGGSYVFEAPDGIRNGGAV